MIKVKKLNRVFTIDEMEVKNYEKMGFRVINEDGTLKESEVKKTYTQKEVEKLTKKLNEENENLTKNIEELTAELETAKTELEEANKKIEELNAELEATKADNGDNKGTENN